MFDKIKKKIKELYVRALGFFRTYLAHIVFLVFTFQLLSFFNTLPYFNIINKYYYYVFAILWILSNFLFKKYITNKRILITGVNMFIIAVPMAIIEVDFLSDILGFVAFILILTYVLRQVFSERKVLREIV